MSKHTFESFKKFWMEEIGRIENEAIDSQGIRRIYLQYEINSTFFQLNLSEEEFNELHLELEMLQSKLVRALETAVHGLDYKIMAFGLESSKVLAE